MPLLRILNEYSRQNDTEKEHTQKEKIVVNANPNVTRQQILFVNIGIAKLFVGVTLYFIFFCTYYEQQTNLRNFARVIFLLRNDDFFDHYDSF